MKILYVSQYYPPEMGAPAARAAELARHWAQAGHHVSILTGFPNHPTGVVPTEWRPRLRRLINHERIDPHSLDAPTAPRDGRAPSSGMIDLYRTWLWPLPNRKAHERMRNYASFCLSAALRGLALPRPDIVIATSPQLLVGLVGWWIAFTRQIPFIFEVRDLWPESLTAVGMGNEDSILHQSLKGIAGFLYERADRIVVVTPAFREHLVQRWRVARERIAVVENGVESDLFSPQPETANHSFRRELGMEDKFLICYVGTMGMAHGLETLLDAAGSLARIHPEVQFMLVGEGAEKSRIQGLARSRNLENVRFLDQQPRERIPAFISASDACLVLLKKTDVFKTVIPTKMLEFMSCARPLILGVDGQARQIVEAADAGVVIEPENSEQLARAIAHLAENRDVGAALGANGRSYVLEHFSRKKTAEKYLQVLDELLRSR
ncbi:MAG TPA: glycosyltransferase family 4 protein [Candidatus Sulfotelmatobacter sp.]|nr:glycosyltransferase family 4 protein [Candidatus Sulfotelmatobacter sp.]